VTSTFSDQHSDTRIFVLSALGSILLHGLVMASLAYMPESQTLKNAPPTVQVTLLPPSEDLQTPQAPKPPLQPHTPMQEMPPSPMPLAQRHRAQPPAPPLRVSLSPPPTVKPSALTLPNPAKTILKDTSAAQAMTARGMMKMRIPAQTQPASPSLPTRQTRRSAANRAMPPIPIVRKERSTARPLPAPPTVANPQTLTATPPAVTGSTSTRRPSIISSFRPVYPRVARESGWEGTVIVRTLIDRNGEPSQVNVRKSSGYPTLDQAAQKAVKSWTFQPAKDGNIPIRKWVDIPIKFDLNS
jgi:periplasmic protein TonB